MSIRVFDTINLSARAMLMQNGALYALGREQTMLDFRKIFVWLKRCAA